MKKLFVALTLLATVVCADETLYRQPDSYVGVTNTSPGYWRALYLSEISFGEDITSGLVHYYRMLEPTNSLGQVVDSSGNSNVATINADATWYGTNAYEFFGDGGAGGYIRSLDGGVFKKDNFTVCMNIWQSDARHQYSFMGDGGPTYSLFLFDDFTPNRDIKAQAKVNGGDWLFYRGEHDFYNWTHLTYTYSTNDAVLHMYINGGEVTNGVTGSVDQGGSLVSYGRAAGWSPDPIRGLVGNIRMYTNRVLTAEEIAAVYEEDALAVIPKEIKFIDWNTNTTDYLDESGNGWDFEALPSVASGPSINGTTNKYLQFDGVDDRLVADARAIPRGAITNITVSFWIERILAAGSIIGNRDPALSSSPFRIFHYAGQTRFYFGSGLDNFGVADVFASAWHHVAFVYDGSQAINTNVGTIWVDGVDSTTSWSASLPKTLGDGGGGDYYIGWDPFGGYGGFKIDDIIVTNVSWTYSQVTNEYDNGNGRD